MKVETQIKLSKFKPRPYQLNLALALEEKGYKKLLAVWARRSGKDFTIFNLMLRAALKKVGSYFYCLPTFKQARLVIWDSITIQGERFLDCIPKELIKRINVQEMVIELINGSILRLIGSDTYDTSLVGTNPVMVVFSEFALADDRAYKFVRPILNANDGTVIVASTPRGRNHFYDLYQIAKNAPSEWFCETLTVDDTGHIPVEMIKRDIANGEISEELARQEYWCDFTLGIEGSYYGRYMDKARLEGRIGEVPYEPAYEVHVAFDLGMRDSTAIIFFQIIGAVIHIIDCYENHSQGLEHYAKYLQSKEYKYGVMIAPHDIQVRELGTGMSRLEKARTLGLNFIVAPNLPITDGIESVRTMLPKCWIDEVKCSKLIKALENYRKEYDNNRKVYNDRPLHDNNSHFCFTENMKVLMENGELPISDVKPGMFVRTPTGMKEVLKVHRKTSNSLCDISVNDTIISCSPCHQIFTQRGIVYADTLRYTDIMEHFSKVSGFLWKMIYGYFSGVVSLNGFKKTILSLKMNCESALMVTFIDGMASITGEIRKRGQVALGCRERYGFITKGKYRLIWLFTTLIAIVKTIQLKILKSWIKATILDTMPTCPAHGPSQKNVVSSCEALTEKPQNGIAAKKEDCGTSNMRSVPCLQFGEQDIRKFVKFATKNMKGSKPGKNIAQAPVKHGVASIKRWIIKTVLVAFARLYLGVIAMHAKKHVVKNVRLYRSDEPRELYDLTIADDNCYYINGYLVSNSDSLRYAAISLGKLNKGSSPEEIEKRYREVMYGQDNNMPRIFRDY